MTHPDRNIRVSYFGPENTNTHLAARTIFGDTVSYRAELTKTGVFDAVQSGRSQIGVAPIENSTEGVVRETMDCLINRDLMIEREFVMEIRHCLMAAPGTESSPPTLILSHPQPLAQCRGWLDAHFPAVPRQSSVSTATAALVAAKTPGTWAIATRLAAEASRLTIIEEDISDRRDNATRFLCIQATDHRPTGNDKTGIVFSAPHERGALLKVLSIFDEAGVNMLRIESRPLPRRRWEYAFVVDVEGHRNDPHLSLALQRLKKDGRLVKVLGSYPRSEPLPAPPESI